MSDKHLYVSMSAAKEILNTQAVKVNNLANANTVGFKSDFSVLESLPVEGDTYPTRVYSKAVTPGHDFKGGSLIPTNNAWDLAIKGEGWLVVQGQDGEEAYTRRGDLTADAEGFLINQAGHRILGEGGPIFIPDHQALSISQDGTISIMPKEAAGNPIKLDKLKLVNPDKKLLHKVAEGYFKQFDGGNVVPAEISLDVTVLSGMQESSNVNAVSELVDIIALAREYEFNVKMMQMAEKEDESTARLLRI